jgi:hypothetical protein
MAPLISSTDVTSDPRPSLLPLGDKSHIRDNSGHPTDVDIYNTYWNELSGMKSGLGEYLHEYVQWPPQGIYDRRANRFG